MIAHLYRIDNIITGDYYIGKHNGQDQRLSETNNRLYWGSGKRIKRQIKKYGVHNFTYTILCIGKSDYIFDIEKRLVTPELIQDEKCLNLDTGGEGSHFHCDETRRKIKENTGPKVITEEQRKQISESLKLHYENNPETKERQVNSRLKTILTEEHRSKRSNISKEIWDRPGYKEKMSEVHQGQSAWNKGKKLSKEQTEKMTEWAREYWKDKPGFMTGKTHSEDTKNKLKKSWENRKKEGKGLTTGYTAINNKVQNKFVKPEMLDEYLNNGWEKGLKKV